VQSGMKGRNSDNSNVTEYFAVNEAWQPRGPLANRMEAISCADHNSSGKGSGPLRRGRPEVEDMADITDVALLGTAVAACDH